MLVDTAYAQPYCKPEWTDIFDEVICHTQYLGKFLLFHRNSNAISREAGKKSARIFTLHESEMCAGGEEGKDACDGDGGAPLVCEGASGRW